MPFCHAIRSRWVLVMRWTPFKDWPELKPAMSRELSLLLVFYKTQDTRHKTLALRLDDFRSAAQNAAGVNDEPGVGEDRRVVNRGVVGDDEDGILGRKGFGA